MALEIVKGEDHYNDGIVDVRYISPAPNSCFDSPLCVFVTCNGLCNCFDCSAYWWNECEALEAYTRIFPFDDMPKEEKAQHVADFKAWLIENGASEEMLEEWENEQSN